MGLRGIFAAACAVLTLPVFGLLAFTFVAPLVSTIWLGVTYSFAAVRKPYVLLSSIRPRSPPRSLFIPSRQCRSSTFEMACSRRGFGAPFASSQKVSQKGFAGREGGRDGEMAEVSVGAVRAVRVTVLQASMWPSIPLVVPQATMGTAMGLATSVQMIGIGVSNLVVGQILGTQSR